MTPEQLRENPHWFGRDSWNSLGDGVFANSSIAAPEHAGTADYDAASLETQWQHSLLSFAYTLETIAGDTSPASETTSGYSYKRNDAIPHIGMYCTWLAPGERTEDTEGRSLMGSLYFVDEAASEMNSVSYHLYDSPAGMTVDRQVMEGLDVSSYEYDASRGPVTFGEIQSAADYAAGGAAPVSGENAGYGGEGMGGLGGGEAGGLE